MATGNKPLIESGWLRALLYAIVTLAVVLLAIFGIGILTALAGGTEFIEAGEESPTRFLLTYGIISLVMVGLAFLFRRMIDREQIRTMGFQWQGYGRQAVAGGFLGILLVCIGSLVLVSFRFLYFTAVDFNAGDLLVSLLLFILVTFTEEIAFRGYILNNLLQSMNKWVALSISAVAFALFHATNPGAGLLPVLNILIAGFLLGINYIYTRNLWFAIFLHFTWNFFQGPILGFEVSGYAAPGVLQQTLKGSDLVTGGEFGFEGSVVCLFINLAAVILLGAYYVGYRTKPTKVDI
jgi:membrane protease YdiL (CAAX protease family)